MRKINKSEPPEFADQTDNYKKCRRKFAEQTANFTNWENEFLNPLKEECTITILNDEQKGLSGYTEMPLDYEKCRRKGLLHIDHFIKRELDPSKMFDWDNLIVDIQRKGNGKIKVPGYDDDFNFGASFKDNKIKTQNIKTEEDRIKKLQINSRLINPVTENPHHFFMYLENGEIAVNDRLQSEDEKQRAKETIEVFNLNHRILKEKNRQSLLDLIRDSQMPFQDVLNCVKEFGFFSVVEFELDREHLYKG